MNGCARNGLVRINRRLSRAALCVAACFGGVASTAAAPTLPKVVAGQASFSQDGNVFSVTNTPGAIINWQSFSVGAGEITRFIQQHSDSAVLNRITGQDPSRILGALQSNGKVFLINPNGVVFGQGARVDVGGLVASTLDMRDADFLAGKQTFSAGPGAGAAAIRNEGAISTPSGGKVFLLAPKVENSGVITAPNGEVVLAAGRSVQLVDAGNPDLSVVVSAPGDAAINLGQVVAAGGRVGIYGALVNQRGVLNADSAVVGRDGRIVLKASRETVLEQGSRTSAIGSGKGGQIQLLGERIVLAGNAHVDASGAAGGGTVLVGGDYQGRNAALPHAQQTGVSKDAVIRADATAHGDGGKVVLWSDGATAAHGSISVRGAGAGNGGLVETSGRNLDLDGIRVDAGAGRGGERGKSGTWLIDPTNIVVGDSGSALDTTYIAASALTATDADIVLQASNNLSIEQGISTPHSVRAEAGNDLSVGAALVSTGSNGTIDLRAGHRLTLAAGGSLASPGYIDLKAERMTLAGNIGGVGGVLPIVSFNTFQTTTDILLRGTEASFALTLNPERLAAIQSYEINIGNSGHRGGISVDAALSMSGNLAIDTAGSININAPVALSGANAQFIGTLHAPVGSAVQVSNVGSISASRKISLLGADRVAIYGELASGDIELSGGSGGIELTRNLDASGRVTLRTEGGVFQTGVIKTPELLVEGGSVNMSGANQVGTLAGAATGSGENSGFRFLWSGDLRIGSVGGRSGLSFLNDVTLTGGALSVDATIDARVIVVDAASIKGAGTLKAKALSLQSRGGIGEPGSPLRTSAEILMNATNTATGTAPIHIVNDRALVVGNVLQAGAGNGGAISIESTGGLTVNPSATAEDGIHTSSGDIRLVTHSPLEINGNVSTDSGNITLLADNKGLLTIGARGQVASASGNVSVTAGEVSYRADAIRVASPDKLSVTKTGGTTTPPPDPKPDPDPPPPPLDVCLAMPGTAGCGLVLENATRACLATPETAQCRQVLPQVEACRTDPGKLGCAVVVVRECIAAPKAPSCLGVLPSYAACEKSPLTYGCAPVVAEYRAIELCIATPKAPSCIGVLPLWETCEKSPNAHGCAPVIAERQAIAACIVNPTGPGCGEILPPLATCSADSGVYGCAPVLERAAFLACVANPSAPGCAARLPALPVCKASPGIEGCSQVLQLAFDACLAKPGDASCSGILPTLSQCVIDKGMAGCQVVLPTLQQCIGSPTLQGCSVILPKLEQCVVNPNLGGCEAILPQPSFCSTHPQDPKCAVFNPGAGQASEQNKPLAEVQQALVNLVNTYVPGAQGKLPALEAAGAAQGGEGAGGKLAERLESGAGPAGTNTGVKNEKPAKKMYCN